MVFIIRWAACLFLLGLASAPLAGWLFRKFEDRGWPFAKTLGLLLCGSVLWALNVPRFLPFTSRMCWVVLAAFACVNWGASFLWPCRGERPQLKGLKLRIIEEAAFLALFLLCVYIVGFAPWAKGVEKYTDYGFLTSMMRSDWLPFKDVWLAGEDINYYYGGQYLMAFLTKLSGAPAGYAYNLMRATVAAFTILLPFSIGWQLMRDKAGPRSRAPWLAGILSGMAVGMAGNGHYMVFGLFERAWQLLTGQPTTYRYWSPTRYIGGSDFPEKNIHEFPAYASVLGDLHAHYINTLFVLTLIALLYAWAQKREDRTFPLKKSLAETALMGVITGLFMWTNYWDYPIYLVVCGSILFFHNLREYPRWGKALSVTALEAMVIAVLGRLAALPFTTRFRMISSKVRLTESHSPLYQMAIVWGLPALFLAGYLLWLWFERRTARREGRSAALALPDLCVLLFGLCGAGLVLLPELVYVVDIYGKTYYRSNTMFKLTYQAFILLGLCMAYISVRAFRSRNAMIQEYGLWGVVILLSLSSYSLYAVSAAFGDIQKPAARIGTDASVFVERFYPEDAKAIRWMERNIAGQPVVLEAHGASESDYERVSVATGLPTVIGWHTHEWLWSGNKKMVNRRVRDVRSIYTSSNAGRIAKLLKKYGVSYVFIGKMEREKYPKLNSEILKTLGTPVYSDDKSLLIRVTPVSGDKP
ncbi:MAG: hypothetical protein IJU98_09385 [Synergistaceae bacterium]|nr:hypothetical protein [Synergistaceae bacterium]